jgi:23S rRNA (guanosine2251-2'-O)-methyltransferase
MIVILDNIRSNHNVGSIFRTADAFGIEKIYLCGITPQTTDRFGRKNNALSKVALGAEEYIESEYSKSTTKLLDKLKTEGYTMLAIELDKKSQPLNKVKIPKSKISKTALVLGSEVDGLSSAILKRADKIVEIPMQGKKESLNVSVAFGITAYELTK